jgi:hypothetical protein
MLYLHNIEVECYSGYKLNESPRAFSFRGTRHVVSDILDRWYEGGAARGSPVVYYFKVLADDGGEFLLRYDSMACEWTLCLRHSEDADQQRR